MPRIVYLLLSDGGIAGGHKMILRHVETLRDLGFDAVCYIGAQSKAPSWLDYNVPLEFGTPVRADDIVVIPEDANDALRMAFDAKLRTLAFSQGCYSFAASTYEILDRLPPSQFPPIVAVAPRQANLIRRAYPQAKVEVVPCFADERIFRPAAQKKAAVALVPRKRPLEAAAIHGFFRKFHPGNAELGWVSLAAATESAVAEAFAAATLFLSLSRLESVGLTPLEAMASGCVCAGFTGVGGWEYATPENGFWAPEDDCEAAADALARAADLVRAGGSPLRRMIEAGRETAEQWSYARFREALEAAWMRLAPEARLRDGPLD